MNTNPDAVTVLCYGDSNTHGTKPDRSGRYGVNERWTGLLQAKLGDSYYIIEEGLGGRTTDLEHYNPGKPSRNGLTYFTACLDSHMPLDCIILMLGTNDLKNVYNRSAQDVANSLKQFPDYVNNYCDERNIKRPKIILVSPVFMDDKAPKFYESMPQAGVYGIESVEKSKQFSGPFKEVADETGCLFFDAATVAKVGEDGCHLTLESHAKLAESLAPFI